MIILGIDPGTATTGYGAVRTVPGLKKEGRRILKCVAYGCITTNPKDDSAKRLRKLYREVLILLRKYRPQALAVENIYFFKNLKTAMPVSQAKGVIMLAAAQKKIPVFEYTPLQIKLAVVGYGNAEKKQVQKMLQRLLRLPDVPRPDDASDALGAAVCHFYSHGRS